jgi:hypothetical protein
MKRQYSVRIRLKNCLACLRNLVSHLKETFTLNKNTEKKMISMMTPEFKEEIENKKLRLLRQYLLANSVAFIMLEALYFGSSNNYVYSLEFKVI